MGILNQVSRIMEVTLTDKGHQMMSLKSSQDLFDMITMFSLFDDGINYNKVDFSIDPPDPNYPTPFILEPSPSCRVNSGKSKLITIPPGAAPIDKTLRVIEVTPFKGEFTTRTIGSGRAKERDNSAKLIGSSTSSGRAKDNYKNYVEATSSEGEFTTGRSIVVTLQTKDFEAKTGNPIFDKDPTYVVYLKDPQDANYVRLSEIVQAGKDRKTPASIPPAGIAPSDGVS